MNTIYRYEIEAQVTNKTTRVSELVTRLEHAYSLMDAMNQAVVAITYQHGDVDLKVVRIGPPLEDVRRTEAALLEALEKMPRQVASAMKDALLMVKK